MKHADIIKQMTLEEKCYLFSGKDFWQTRSLERLGVPNMTLSDGPHGIRKQAGEGDQLGLNPSLPATCYPTAATVANSWDPAGATSSIFPRTPIWRARWRPAISGAFRKTVCPPAPSTLPPTPRSCAGWPPTR